MEHYINRKIYKSFLISILVMLLMMVLATRVFSLISNLIYLYAIGYMVQLFATLYAVSSPKIRIKRLMINVLFVYFVILCIPLLNAFLSGVVINYFDPINAGVKIVNFFLFFVAVYSIKSNEKDFEKFMRIIVIISVMACLYSFFFEFEEILSIRYVTNTNALSIRSFFSNRNQYAMFLFIAFVANTYLIQISRTKLRVLVYVIQIIGVLTTFSRGALFSIVVMVSLLYIQSKNAKRKFAVFIMMIVIIIGIVFSSGLVEYFLHNYVRLEESADSGRFILWKYAWDVFVQYSYLGVGFYTGVDIAQAKGMGLSQFHNMFFDILVDGGILELLFVGTILFVVYKNCKKKCKNERLVAVYNASLLAFLFHACFESLSLFALSYADTMYTIFYVSIPILLSNMERNDSAGGEKSKFVINKINIKSP